MPNTKLFSTIISLFTIFIDFSIELDAKETQYFSVRFADSYNCIQFVFVFCGKVSFALLFALFSVHLSQISYLRNVG